MDVKAALSGNDRKTILDSCEYGEDVILKVYKKILIEDHQDTSSTEQDLLNKHYALLKSDHDKVKDLRELIINEKR
jgi:uncharacterized protein (TIGR02284 family)